MKKYVRVTVSRPQYCDVFVLVESDSDFGLEDIDGLCHNKSFQSAAVLTTEDSDWDTDDSWVRDLSLISMEEVGKSVADYYECGKVRL